MLKDVTSALENYEYAVARECLEDFFWNDFCDNYLEIIKVRVYSESKDHIKGKVSSQYSLYHILNVLLRVFAIYLPHITEEIYSSLYSDKSIHSKGNWPFIDINLDKNYISQVKNSLLIVDYVRKAKAKDNLSLKSEIEKIEYNFGKDFIFNEDVLEDLKNVTNSLSVKNLGNISKGSIYLH